MGKYKKPGDEEYNNQKEDRRRKESRENTPYDEMNPEPQAQQQEIMSDEEARQKFEEESSFSEARPVELPTVEEDKGDDEEHPSLREAMSSSSDLTDMQFAAEKLFPAKLGVNRIHNSLMVGRIDPNAFLAMLHLCSIDRIMTELSRNYKKTVNVNDIYMEQYTLLSVGLDGEGRIDQLELAGAAREEKRLQSTFGANPLGR